MLFQRVRAKAKLNTKFTSSSQQSTIGRNSHGFSIVGIESTGMVVPMLDAEDLTHGEGRFETVDGFDRQSLIILLSHTASTRSFIPYSYRHMGLSACSFEVTYCSLWSQHSSNVLPHRTKTSPVFQACLRNYCIFAAITIFCCNTSLFVALTLFVDAHCSLTLIVFPCWIRH